MLVLEHPPITLPVGFKMRHVEMADAEAVEELLNDCQEPLTGKRPFLATEIRSDWTQVGFDLSRSARVITTAEDRIVGYAELWDINKPAVRMNAFARVHPDYEGLGLATALHDWIEARARETVPEVPEDLRVSFECGVLDHHHAGLKLLQGRGYELVRHFFRMGIDFVDVAIPAPVLPEGVVIRPWTAVQEQFSLRDIVAVFEEAFQDHWGHVAQPLESLLKRWEHFVATAEDYHPDNWFLAIDGDQLAGISLCFTSSQGVKTWGYVGDLAVLRPWRRHGLGLALLHHSFRAFQAAGFTRMELHVDAASLTGATRLYEKAGMSVAERSQSYRKVLRPGRDVTTQ